MLAVLKQYAPFGDYANSNINALHVRTTEIYNGSVGRAPDCVVLVTGSIPRLTIFIFDLDQVTLRNSPCLTPEGQRDLCAP